MSEAFDGIAELFYMVEGKNKGHYGLIDHNNSNFDLSADDDEFSEGKEFLILHLMRERNQYLVTKSKRKFKDEHNGKLFCEACGFDFSETYGDLGNGFIEAHHIKPISKWLQTRKLKSKIWLCYVQTAAV